MRRLISVDSCVTHKGLSGVCQTVLNPAPFFEDCVYDVCLYNGRSDILCQAITAYVSACQAMGRTISPGELQNSVVRETQGNCI